MTDADEARRWLLERGVFEYDREGRPRDFVTRSPATFRDPKTLAMAAAAGFRTVAITTRDLGWTDRQRAGEEE